MAGIKEKISATMDKLTHKNHTNPNTGTTTHNSGASGVGGLNNTSSYNNSTTGTGVTGTGTGVTGTGTGVTGTGTGASTGGLQTGAAYGTTGVVEQGRGAVIDSETFTKTEDHEVLIEKKQYELEHRPVQKQYVVETRMVGESAVAGKPTEYVGSEEREVDERIKRAPAGDRTVIVENVDVPVADSMQNTRTTGMTGTGATGTGMSGTGATGTGMTGTGNTY